MNQNGIAVLIAHPQPARLREFYHRWRAGTLPQLPRAGVRLVCAWIARAADLEAQVAAHRPDILVVHGSLLGDQPAFAVMWVLTQGAAGVLITDDSDPARQFVTKRCHVLPLGGGAEGIAAALSAEITRVRQERAQRSR